MKRIGIFILACMAVVYGVSALRVAHSQSYNNQPWAQYVAPPLNDGMTRYTQNLPLMRIQSDGYTPNDLTASRENFQRCEEALTRNFRTIIQRGLQVFEVVPCTEYTQFEFNGEKSHYYAEILFFSKY